MRAAIRLWLMLFALGLCAGSATAAYPDRPIRLVVPFPPGGPVDVVARIVAPKLGARLRQKVLIDHIPGQDGITGTDAVAKAAPDGYTLLIAPNTLSIHPGTYGKLPYDTQKALVPISLLVAAQYVLVINPSLPVYSVEELIDYAKNFPGKLRYAAAGVGGPSQLAFELFKITTGTDFKAAPYTGGAAALDAVANNDAQAMLAPLLAAVPMIHDGKLRGLAVTGANRAPAAPELPSITETLPGFTALAWYGVLAPAGTPKPIISRLNAELDRIVHTPEVVKQFATIGGEPVGGSPEILAGQIRQEIPKWIRVAREAGLRVE
jgi:tripartite-type tricarboxylate transporter receptor subunit TctC